MKSIPFMLKKIPWRKQISQAFNYLMVKMRFTQISFNEQEQDALHVGLLKSYVPSNILHCTKVWSIPLMISSVNVTKSAVPCGFGHIYWKNPNRKHLFWCIVKTNTQKWFRGEVLENLNTSDKLFKKKSRLHIDKDLNKKAKYNTLKLIAANNEDFSIINSHNV